MDYNEADTCRKFVTPQLVDTGWESPPHSLTEQRTFTDGRIVVTGGRSKRGEQKIADYILRYRHDFPIAVVEAKKYRLPAAQGLQQAKDYAEILGLKFAYATNGQEIIEFDYFTGQQRKLAKYPTPDELWARWSVGQGITPETAKPLLEPTHREQGKTLRYYQEIAINRTVQAIAQGQRRILLTMATGTGKTHVAFQICWKLWKSQWNKDRSYRKPRILFLADRNILVDDPKDKTFAPFEDARFKIEKGKISKGREMYFAIYQAIASREGRPGLYREFPPDFFDLIVVDECHRGSARDDSNWREILEYFQPAYQLGMTATPLRDDNHDTYAYFGNPLYQYSLKQGIEDGFLAPYTVHRVVTDLDAAGWRPNQGQRDRYGREIPDQEYTTDDFDRVIAIRERTEAIAKHISDFLGKSGNRYAKTIVFCVDQEHALEMADALARYNDDLMGEHSDWVGRVTSDEGDIGRGLLDKFKDVEKETPIILTTSKLLTTGVDVPTCKNVVIARVVNSMTEFKQIIGRGTRVRDDYGKLFFNILDYTGSATARFADRDFDGYPASITQEEIDEQGNTVSDEVLADADPTAPDVTAAPTPDLSDHELERRKLYVDNVEVEIVAEMVYELDASGRRNIVKFTDYTAEQVRTLYPNSAEMRKLWADPLGRSSVITNLNERGIDFERLMGVMNQQDADPFDLLCHVAFNAPIRTRRERANRVQIEETAFFEQYTSKAREILLTLLEKYAEHGTAQFTIEVLKVPPLSNYGNISEIARLFGGADKLKQAVEQLQTLLYAA
ncbi:MAG: DEAD/DEAH box helicase family protein [Anaerolineae bacterium]|nr:DEAD/DEAH box helicase family protein [Anaerolineae bacterium]